MANEPGHDGQRTDQYQGENRSRHGQVPERERHHQGVLLDGDVGQRGLEHDFLEIVLETIDRPRGQIGLYRGFGEALHGRAGGLGQASARGCIVFAGHAPAGDRELLELYVIGVEVHFSALRLVTWDASGRHGRGNRLAQDRALYFGSQRQAIFRQLHCHALDRHVPDRPRELLVQARLERDSEKTSLLVPNVAQAVRQREHADDRDDDPGKLAFGHGLLWF